MIVVFILVVRVFVIDWIVIGVLFLIGIGFM